MERQGAFRAQKFQDLRRGVSKNPNMISNKSWRSIASLRREVYTECNLGGTRLTRSAKKDLVQA